MDSQPIEALRTLRDIKGVQGSFVVRAGNGELLGRDMPEVIDDTVLAAIGPRIDRLLNLVESAPPTELVAMRFGDQRLDIKRMRTAYLCVLAEATISSPALRMGIRLVGRKLDGHPWKTPPLPPTPPKASPAPPSTEPPPRTVQFRGRQTTL